MSEAQQSFRVGQSVHVIHGLRNNTPRRGVVSMVGRHHKDDCFDYYIRQCDKRVSKRYRDEDLIADSINSSWLTETVVALATGIAADCAFDHLPILADALEEAGCVDVELLNHLRGNQLHKRGCWAVDLVLGARRS